MKTVIDIDDELLARAAQELGTQTKKDTVNSALAFVAERRDRLRRLYDGETPFPISFGAGPDIADPEIMRQARR